MDLSSAVHAEIVSLRVDNQIADDRLNLLLVATFLKPGAHPSIKIFNHGECIVQFSPGDVAIVVFSQNNSVYFRHATFKPYQVLATLVAKDFSVLGNELAEVKEGPPIYFDDSEEELQNIVAQLDQHKSVLERMKKRQAR